MITEAPVSAAPPEDAGKNTSRPALDLDKLSLDELNTLYEGGTVDVPILQGVEGTKAAPVAAPPAPVVEKTIEVPVADPVETAEAPAAPVAEVPAVPAEPAAPVVEPNPVNRPRLDEREQAIMGVYMHAKNSGNPISMAEAESRVDGPPKVVVPPTPPVDHTALISILEADVLGLTNQLTAFEEGLWTPEIAKIQSQLADKKLDLRDAKRDLNQAASNAEAVAATAKATSETNRSKAHAQALEDYPDIQDANTALGKAVSDYVREIENPNHPDHDILWADSAPLAIARTKAGELGILPKPKAKAATPAATPPVVAKVEAPPRAVMSPVPGNKTSVAPVEPVMDGKQAIEYLKKDGTLDQLDEVFGGGDPLAFARNAAA